MQLLLKIPAPLGHAALVSPAVDIECGDLPVARDDFGINGIVGWMAGGQT
jgi:hypothetical protein